MYRLWVVFLIGYILFSFLLISYAGVYGWDDGAITLAYGKTIATAGKYALTASSEIAEGSSSNFLVLLTAVFYKIFSPDFSQIINFSQYNALFFTIITLLMLFLFLRKGQHYSAFVSLFVAFSVGLLPMYFIEICNGMEMTMLSAFLLIFLWFYKKRSVWVFPVIIVLLLIRFESVFYLGVALFGQIVFNKQERIYAVKLLTFTVVSFLLYTAARYSYFDDWLPNTIVAKMNPPYSEASFEKALMSKLDGGLNFIKSYFFALILIVIITASDLKKYAGDIKLWLIFGFFIFTLVSGSEWGYRGRMTFAVFPVMIIFLAENIDNNQLFFKNILPHRKYVMIFLVILLTLFTNNSLYKKLYSTLVHGGYCQQKYLPNSVAASFIRGMPNPCESGVTPDNIRITGKAVDSLKNTLRLNVVKLVTPDVGGIGLAFDKIDVIDSGLLTNKTLAHKGYSYFDNYIRQRDPDIINTHDVWTKVSHIFSSDYFKSQFLPVIFDNNLLWLNKKYVNNITTNTNLNYRYLLPNEINPDVRFFDQAESSYYPPVLDISLKQK